ncbi:DNA repair protein complementing XP-G cells homolog isoform X2 [Dendronephthya gigantea]|uniref:DNA repair protein complementing XP-G cells homolog isoform X2 n=1 Tax=Dendronephthya gigantea TaxID=151771 RepID=UPI00106AEB50|nr:DNA repair protein complementing XP-G cells homolog isoform X2 [Dendronephthya gigantea]
MGVNGLWKLLEPAGRPITLESLENKTLAVDVSVWLNQALYGMRSQHGSTVPNAHLVLLFQRICKLLYYRIKPIFVFDGGVPELKKKTMAARRAIRLSARNKAQKISKNVLEKYLKSRAIGSVTGRKSRRPTSGLGLQQVQEKDLFELPPLPEKEEPESPSVDESFFSSHHLQDTTDLNIDSEGFRELPHEIQHELIVEMHEKSKRHSRYQDVDMPEESEEFSNFQLDHLLKRGKLTQRLGTIRKEMNEKQAGELVVGAVGEMSVNSIIQSQKIMSEETGHSILIKRTQARKTDELEDEADEMAGGFFREISNEDVVHPQPILLKDLPKITSDIAKPSVSGALDEAASSTDESGDGNEPEIVYNETFPYRSSKKVIGDGNGVAVPHITNEDFPKTVGEKEVIYLSEKEQPMQKESTESNDLVLVENRLDSVGSNEQKVDSNNGNIHTNANPPSREPSEQKVNLTSNEDLQIEVGRELSENVTIEIAPSTKEHEDKKDSEKDLTTIEDELDDFEDEIKKKKSLIEQLLSNRRPSVVNESANSNVGNISDEKLSEEKPFSEISPQRENNFKNDDKDSSSDETKNLPSAMAIMDESVRDISDCEAPEPAVNDISAQNEFEGKTYEELGEIQMRLDEDLENLKEEKTRQSRLAATVTDEMYKDSQELLHLFGIPFVVSPMEAEAQCATLDRHHLCDGSITEDSDIILFGAKKVYKNVFNQKYDAELYQEDDVKCILGLDRLNLIAIALLTGSDYTEGVQGLGIVSAMEIINEFSGEGIEKLQNLKNWLEGKSKLLLHESKVKSKLKNVVLPTGFPSSQVFEAYLNPAVDDSREAFSWANPDLHSLRLFASEKLGWSKMKTDEILLPVIKRLNTRERSEKN